VRHAPGRRSRTAAAGSALAAAALLLATAAAPASAHTVWLCRPGARPDPCAPGLSTTVVTPSLHRLRVVRPASASRPAIDCFYVYPTVSQEPGPLADLRIQAAERSVALLQAARYSQYCDVFAPMYRQVTVPELVRIGVGSAVALQLGTPLRDVEHAFADFLAHLSHGRGFVLIGHSQGAFILRRLIATEIDPHPALRARLVSAILLGGNVLVRTGSDIGGDFRHIPACTRAGELHCVIAYSTFDGPVPATSLFGQSPVAGDSVLCTNPAALGGGSGLLDPIFPAAGGELGPGVAAPGTVWTSEPGAYSARCSSAGGADVLQITPRDGAFLFKPSPTPDWGLHLEDASIALGNLVRLVGEQGAAYARAV
jgi:hypothetical protein